jgi:threonine dehydrogenase-like Zn-dependent dehydrogenase
MSAHAGAEVFAIGDHSHTREVACAFGATSCYERSQISTLHGQLGNRRADVVITTSNAWSDWPLALECTGQRGPIAVLGFPGRQEGSPLSNPFDSRHFYERQLRINAVGMLPERADARGFLPFNERANIENILRWIGEGRLQPRSLLSGEYPGMQLGAAYEALLGRSSSPITFLLRWKSWE